MSIGVAEDAAEDTLTCKMEGVPTDSSNLAIKVSTKPVLATTSCLPSCSLANASKILH